MHELFYYSSLFSMGIPLRDFTEYFKSITGQLTANIESSAGELGRPIVYLVSGRDKKENIAKDFLLSDSVDEGLICVLKTLESCRTARVVGGGSGKYFLNSAVILTALPNPLTLFLALSKNLSGRATSGVWISASSQPISCSGNVPF